MTPFAYLLVLVSIVMSLAMADISTSLHRLLRARRQVRSHWLTPAAGLWLLACAALPDNVVLAAVLLSLALVRSRAYHFGLILLLLLTLGFGWFPLKLG